MNNLLKRVFNKKEEVLPETKMDLDNNLLADRRSRDAIVLDKIKSRDIEGVELLNTTWLRFEDRAGTITLMYEGTLYLFVTYSNHPDLTIWDVYDYLDTYSISLRSKLGYPSEVDLS